MIEKQSCPHCENGVEFDTEEIQYNQDIICPHCSKTFVLRPYIASIKEPQNKLKNCNDCGHEISKKADSCPNCGLSFVKKHGVFYYVFWTLMSIFLLFLLVNLAIILFVFGVPAFLKGYERSKEKSEVQITNSITFSNRANETGHSYVTEQEKEAYKKQIQIADFITAYHATSEGRVAGVEFRMKNAGDKILNKIEVTVYFMDYNNQVVSEEKYNPVYVSRYGSDNNPLKPGYIWQMEPNHFYSAEHVPNEWKSGNARIEITDIEFADHND